MLTTINYRSTELHHLATNDIEIYNLLGLIDDLQKIRDSWVSIIHKFKLVAKSYHIITELASGTAKRHKKLK